MARLDNPILHAQVDVSINSGPATKYFAVVSYDVAEKWCRQDVGAPNGEHLPFESFKIGEGGWVSALGEQVRREPEPSMSDLDCIENPERYPGAASERYYFQKNIGSMSYVADRKSKAECTILSSEANNDGVGNPDFWEVALFDSGNNMVVYATIDKLTKDATKTVDLTFTIYR